ncbi:urease accessory UreF family protein [Thiomicrorhabdus sp. 6S3-12]|uniref:urease accessory protein UreF n=1 Tax=Thiomicrorhabdus sp. 6S3-12 TaxID=2819681 RepID=UPI001AADB333|nr:urease accessory protein UreF [Thiomicrorhabdus sp. 6S3-12]
MSQQKLLRLLQLNSPSLPIGAYAYSQGLEAAVHQGQVADIKQAKAWMTLLLRQSLANNDLAVIAQAYAHWQQEDYAQLNLLAKTSRALRETEELLQEDSHLSRALLRLAEPMGVPIDDRFNRKTSFPVVYARFAQVWRVDLQQALTAFAWSWLENQIAALLKLCSIGQTQAQVMMLELDEVVLEAVKTAQNLPKDALGMSLPNYAILSAQHEIQYSRLFRS